MNRYQQQSRRRRAIYLHLATCLLLLLPFLGQIEAMAQVETTGGRQSNTTVPSTIFEELLADRRGEGMIFIHQSPAILKLVGRPASALENAQVRNGYAYLRGYQVQVYSGNLSHSRSIANTRRSAVQAQFPEQEVQLDFKAPFWRVRVGNFVEMSEARELLTELKEAFPAFAKEMYVVRSTIRIPQ